MIAVAEIRRISKLSFIPYPGSFAKVSGDYEGCWYSCREEFHWVNANTRHFLYSHRPNAHEKIAAFIEKVEKRLRLKERSVLTPTQYNRVTYVVMSPWWRFSIRRSLFTALLRAGQNYDGENFEETLFSKKFHYDNYYTQETEGAVRRFLRGYTSYIGNVQGWWDAFEGSLVWDWRHEKNRTDLEKLLVKPESN